jgi:DNA-binding HxlR family transcriptional regulator
MVVDSKLINKSRILILAHLRDNGKTRFINLKKDLGMSTYGSLAWHIKVLSKYGYVKSDTVGRGHSAVCNIKSTPKGIKSLDEISKFINNTIVPN